MTKVTVLDGSVSTQIFHHTGKTGDGDPLWTARFLVTDPDAVKSVHLDFLRAGSDIIETATYQASLDGFSNYLGMSESEGKDVLRKAVDLAKQAIEIYKEEIQRNEEAVNRCPKIAGSCGPYGATLHDASEYTGSYGKSVSREFLMDWHRSKIQTLVEAGVDIVAIETIPCAEEAEALVELMKEFPGTKAWLSFSCTQKGDSKETLPDGSEFRDVAMKCWKNAAPGQLVAVGINCVSPQRVSDYLEGLRGLPGGKEIPLVIYPNSGEIYVPDEGWKTGEEKVDIEKYVHHWLDQGVQFIGGCCRVNAMEVAKIRAQVENWRSQERETSL